MPTAIKTKINSKVVAGVFILAGLVIGSLVFTALLPGSDMPFLAATVTKTVPVSGWCVTSAGIFGSNGSHMAKTSCLDRANDTDPNTVWYAFCPDISGQPARDSSTCNATYPDIIKSSLLDSIIAKRDSLVENLNNGEVTTAEAVEYFQYSIAIKLKYACRIYFSNDKMIDPAVKTYTMDVGMVKPIQGNAKFLKTVGVMFSKMVKPENKCELFPPTCIVSDSYRSYCACSSSSSAHCCGEAVDISCSDMAGKLCDTNQTSRDKVAAINSKIMAAGPVYIIRECYAKEKDKATCGDGSNTPIIHFDIKNRSINDVAPCVYENCDFSSCVK